MATQEKTWNVANRLHSQKDSNNPEVNHIIAGADEIYDDAKGAKQSDINAQADAALADRYTKDETYSKEQLDSLITTPDVEYVNVVATNATTAATDVLPATGEANTIYRVGNWNGTQYDPTMYALLAWNGSAYVCLAVRSFVGEVYDISANHLDSQGNPTPYADLAAALGTNGANIPADIRRGGMSIKFIQGTVQSSDNKYAQYRLILDTFSTTESDWQGEDIEITENAIILEEWQPNTDYVVGNQRQTGNPTKFYRCKTAHTSGLSFDATEQTNWAEIASFENGVSAMQQINIGNEQYPIYQKCIKLLGLAVSSADFAAVNVGDVFYNTRQHALRIKKADDSLGFLPFFDGVVYVCGSELYVWNGASLVLASPKIQTLRNLTIADFSNDGYINPSGAYVAASGFYCSDFINIDGVDLIDVDGVELTNEYVSGIAFYSDNNESSFISRITHTKDYKTIEVSEIPVNAKYVRFGSNDNIKANTRVDIYIKNTAQRINEIIKNSTESFAAINNSLSGINSNIDALNQKTDSTITKYGLEDTGWFDDYYETYGLGQYLNKGQQIGVSTIKLRYFDFGSNQSIDYRIYKCTSLIGSLSNNHTLLQSGTLSKKGSGYNDYDITLNEKYSIAANEYVAIYIKGSAKIKTPRGQLPQGQTTANRLILNLDQDAFNTDWNIGDVTDYRAYSLWAYSEPLFILTSEKENIKNEILNEVEEDVANIINSEFDAVLRNLKLTIPNTIWGVVGTQINLWNDTVSLSVDKGLYSPINYQIRWDCSKGKITERGFQFTPTAEDVGTTNCTCYLYNMMGELVVSKTFGIVILAKDVVTNSKRIVYFGDSLGADAAIELYKNFHDSNKFAGTIPTMLGTRYTDSVPVGSDLVRVNYEAVGGYGWADYATKGKTQYRIQVTGVTSVGVGAVYAYSGTNYTIREVNITSGTGNILLEKGYGEAGNIEGVTSGIITKVSGTGDSSINFTDTTKEGNNPLWDASLNEGQGGLSVAKYRERLGLASNELIDVVSFQFGINDAALADNLTKLTTYITNLYNAFIADNPNCMFLIGLTTTCGNTLDGSGANYGASNDWKTYQDRVYRIRQFYIELQATGNYPKMRICPTHLFLDRYYGYGFGLRRISQRFNGLTVTSGGDTVEIPAKELYHNNFVHPIEPGYGQMADAYLGIFTRWLKD